MKINFFSILYYFAKFLSREVFSSYDLAAEASTDTLRSLFCEKIKDFGFEVPFLVSNFEDQKYFATFCDHAHGIVSLHFRNFGELIALDEGLF